MYSHDTECECLSKVAELPDEFIQKTYSCLDDLYSTAIRLTNNASAAEELLQCTLHQGALYYSNDITLKDFRSLLLNIMKSEYAN